MRRGGPAGAAALLTGAALLAAAPPAAGDPRVRGDLLLESDTAFRLYSPHVPQKSQNRLELDAEMELADGLRLRGLGRLLWDPVGRLVGSDPDFGQDPVDRWQVGGSRTVEAELRELTLDWRTRLAGARLDVTLGKQQVVWGQSFGLRVLDVVNAQTFREAIVDDFVDARTPVWGARVDALVKGVAVQALWFPDFEPDVLPDPESEFALVPELVGLLPALVAAPGRPPAAVFGDPERPDDGDPSSWGFGGRVGGHLHGVDWSLHYWDRRDPQGVFRRDLAVVRDARGAPVPVNVLVREFPRVRSGGFSFSTVLGDFVLWGEGTGSAGRRFVTRDPTDPDGTVERPSLDYALGLDWSGWEPLFANVQFIQSVIFDHDGDIALEAHREFVSVLLRFDLLREVLFPQLFVLYGVQRSESWIRPAVEWRATDRLSVTAGADLFTGDADGLLGQYAARRECVPVPAGLPLPGAGGCLFDAPPGRPSRVFVRLRYRFGF